MSHDQKSCDIYKKSKWHKQASTLNFNHITPWGLFLLINSTWSFLDLILAKLLSDIICFWCQQWYYLEKKFPDLLKSSGDHPVKFSPANICNATSQCQPLLIPQGELKQQYKCPKHSKLSPTNLSLPRKCADTSGELVWTQWWIGFTTSILWVQFSNTVPLPAITITIGGKGITPYQTYMMSYLPQKILKCYTTVTSWHLASAASSWVSSSPKATSTKHLAHLMLLWKSQMLHSCAMLTLAGTLSTSWYTSWGCCTWCMSVPHMESTCPDHP